MSRVELVSKPNKTVAPREVVTSVTIGLESPGEGGSWMSAGADSKWYYKIMVNGVMWQEYADATMEQALAVLTEYADLEKNLTLRVRDKMRMYLDPDEAVVELKAMQNA